MRKAVMPFGLGRFRMLIVVLALFSAALLSAMALASHAGAFVYWSDGGDLANPLPIARADPNASEFDLKFIPGFAQPRSVAVDGDHVYWTTVTNTIGRADLDGSNIDQDFITGADEPVDIEVDGSHIYWLNARPAGNQLGTIGRADLDGSNVNQSFITTGHNPTGLAVDGGHIWWVSHQPSFIGRADLDGTNVNQEFIETYFYADDLALSGDHVYWTNPGYGSIARADLDGTNVNEEFIAATDAGSPTGGIAVDASHVYWANYGLPPNSPTIGAIGRADLDGTNVDKAFVDSNEANGTQIQTGDVAVDANHLYWQGVRGPAQLDASPVIGRADLDGSNVDQNFIRGPADVEGLALDADHIYWTNFVPLSCHYDSQCASPIGRANRDGSDPDWNFITAANNPAGLALDANHIYWTNGGEGDVGAGSIGRADLDGSNVDQSFISGASGPFGLAIAAGHIYWANDTAGTIGRADLDGTNVDQNFITAPAALGLAADESHLYWTDYYGGTIGRADLDGTNVNQGFISAIGGPWGLALDDSRVFWTSFIEFGDDAIGRANLDGTDFNPSFMTNVSVPGAIAVDNPASAFPDTTITSGPQGPADDASPTFGFSSDRAGSTFECHLDSAAWSACSSPQSYSSLADGPHSFEVRATDQEDNTDPTPASRGFSIGTDAPSPQSGLNQKAAIKKCKRKHPKRSKKRKRCINKAKKRGKAEASSRLRLLPSSSAAGDGAFATRQKALEAVGLSE